MEKRKNRKAITGSLNCSLTFLIMASVSSNLLDIISVLTSCRPTSGATWERNGPNWFLRFKILSMPFSTAVGNESNRSVWPVGAVSNTTTEKFILETSLFKGSNLKFYFEQQRKNKYKENNVYFMTSEKLTASSMPGNEPTISWSIALPALKKS